MRVKDVITYGVSFDGAERSEWIPVLTTAPRTYDWDAIPVGVLAGPVGNALATIVTVDAWDGSLGAFVEVDILDLVDEPLANDGRLVLIAEPASGAQIGRYVSGLYRIEILSCTPALEWLIANVLAARLRRGDEGALEWNHARHPVVSLEVK